jgi:kynurenine formamidase
MNAVRTIALQTLFLLFPSALFAQPIDLTGHEFVDLTHTYDADTIYWPTSPTQFELDEISRGRTEGGWFYSAFSFSMPEHGGTHLDAPYHFGENGNTIDLVPLTQLIGAAVVIDVSEQAAADRDYRLSVEDVAAFEAQHGEIDSGSIVLLRTGWSAYWPDIRAYLGDDTPGDASNLSFPSYGEDAVEFLISDRNVAAIGVDTASIDYGRSQNFPVHQAVAAANVPGLENLTGLENLPPTGAIIIALPIKLGGGSGGPVRVVAVLP